MIIGIGTDIIDIKRIEKTIDRFKSRFKVRVFTDQEVAKCEREYSALTRMLKDMLRKKLVPRLLEQVFEKEYIGRILKY